MKTITTQQARAADRKAVEQLAIPEIVLMENAARHAAEVAVDMLPARDSDMGVENAPHIIILAGGGNNGGDGYAMARHLHLRGCQVALYALRSPDELEGSAAINAVIARHIGLPIHLITDIASVDTAGPAWDHVDLLVDAMLGTGFTHDQVRQPAAVAIARCNLAREQAGVKVLALDVPSGLNAGTGTPANVVIHADVTVTFLAMKKGLALSQAKPYTGRVLVRDIGVSPDLLLEVNR